MFYLRGCEIVNYTIMLIFVALLSIISFYVINSYKPQAFCFEKDLYIELNEIKKSKKTKRRYFKPLDKQFYQKILFNYFVVAVSLVILFTIYIKSEYFFGYKFFLELITTQRTELIIRFLFLIVMLFSPILFIILTVKTIVILIEAYTTTIKAEKNHLIYNNKFRTINIFYDKEKHSIFIEKGYIKGVLGNKSNIIYYKVIFNFNDEKRELKLYGFREKDIIEMKNFYS